MLPDEEERLRELVSTALDRYRSVKALIPQEKTSKVALQQATIEAGEALSEARDLVLAHPWDCWLLLLEIPLPAATTYMAAFEATRTRDKGSRESGQEHKELSPSEALRILEEIRIGQRSLVQSYRDPQIVEACRLFIQQSPNAPSILRSVAYAVLDGAVSDK